MLHTESQERTEKKKSGGVEVADSESKKVTFDEAINADLV